MEPELIQVSVAGRAVLASVAAGIDKKCSDKPDQSGSDEPKPPIATAKKENSDKNQN